MEQKANAKPWKRTLKKYNQTPRVECYTKNGKFLQSFKSVWIASKKNTAKARRILRVINEQKLSHKGLVYKFTDDTTN